MIGTTLLWTATIRLSTPKDYSHAKTICDWYKASALERGTGIATRTIAYIKSKMEHGDSIIAFDKDKIIGFCYIETFENKNYVSNSGLIVFKEYRGRGLARKIKKNVFQLAREKHPNAKIFGITTSDKVMKINNDLGYYPTTFSNLTSDESFWKSCSSCPNYKILLEKNKKMCLCTAMVAPPKDENEK